MHSDLSKEGDTILPIGRKIKGGFPLLRNFHMRTHVNFTGFTCENKIETMYERSRVNVKVERGSTFTFTRDFSYIVSIL